MPKQTTPPPPPWAKPARLRKDIARVIADLGAAETGHRRQAILSYLSVLNRNDHSALPVSLRPHPTEKLDGAPAAARPGKDACLFHLLSTLVSRWWDFAADPAPAKAKAVKSALEVVVEIERHGLGAFEVQGSPADGWRLVRSKAGA